MRQADRNDVAIVRSLTRSAYAKWVPIVGREPKPMTADYERAIELHRIDLLMAGTEVVALIEVVCEPGCLFIENVAVEPRHQGKGYGRLLLAHAEELAKSTGCTSIRLYTNRLMLANIELYSRLGYTIDGEEELPHGTVVYMSKPLMEIRSR